MKKISHKVVPVLLVLAMMTGGALLWAQEDGDGERDGDRRERRQVDREQMRERMRERQAAMAERMREQLGVSEEEWNVLEPMIREVRTLQAQGQVGMRGGFAGRGRGFRRGGPDAPGGPRGGGGDARELSPVQQATRDLGQTLRDDNASEADIQAKLEALRSAREAHQQQLDEARQELREVLTPRQEAQLVMVGVLD